jgi:hypothetical protein
LVSSGNALYSAKYYDQQKELITSLGRRLNFAVSQLTVDVANNEQLQSAEKQRLANLLHRAVLKALRGTDQAFACSNDATRFAVILPATPKDNVYFVTDNVRKALGVEAEKYSFHEESLLANTTDLSQEPS